MHDLAAEFETSYARLRAIAYRPAFRLLGDRATALEVADESVARAFVRWRRVRDYPEPWVVTTATNLALDIGRRRSREAHNRWQLLEEPRPDLQVEARLDLQQALRELPRRQRQVVVLRFLGDLSVEETAQALGIDEGTVKTHSSRGLARLRTGLERV